MMAIPTPTQNVLNNIYKAIMRGFLHDFDSEVRDMGDTIVTAAIATYQYMAITFLPTPSKAHYLFNMRDLSKCIQGILQANKEVVVRKVNMIRLYYHECLRVFHDRLTTEQDRTIFCKSLADICTSTFKMPTDVDECKGIIFGDFMKMGTPKSECIYDEIMSKEKLKHVLTVLNEILLSFINYWVNIF
jgi:dynein heavy chain